jgi:hypothetical protein
MILILSLSFNIYGKRQREPDDGDDANLAFWDASIKSCNNPIRISNRFAWLHLFNLILKVLFFDSGKGNESDAAPIPTLDLITPHHDTARLPINKFLKADNTRLYRMICLYSDTYYAAIYDFGKIIRADEISKRDDSEGMVEITRDGVPYNFFSLSTSFLIHAG